MRSRQDSRRPIIHAAIVVAFAYGAAAARATDDPPALPRTDRSLPAQDRRRDFSPGVHIDWKARVVEVDATVVLRRGPLELFACSPKTREHESILSVAARPLHIFQAMGLIGLEPGAPARYDEGGDQWLPPTGQRLDLRVRCKSDRGAKTSPLEQWLRDVERRRPAQRIPWVFAGSRVSEGGRFGADLDGTIICVVDFDTALIAVSSLHSADNDALWLEADTDKIPPVGTQCTILIRAAAGHRIDVDLSADGTLRHKDQPVTPTELAALTKLEGNSPDEAPLRLRPHPDATGAVVRAVVDSLVAAGIPRASVRVQQPDPPNRPDQPPG